MSEILKQLSVCIERGKVNQASPYPPDMQGGKGADELTQLALETGTSPSDVLNQALMLGMKNIGDK